MYTIREFAARAGVTVRALHHYDRVGLLKPRRTQTSYRVYRDDDLPRIQQIVVLKFLGLSLSEIAAALKNESRLRETLRTRRFALKWKRGRLAMALHVIDELQNTPRDWADLATFVHEVGGPADPDRSQKNPQLLEALRLIGERRMALDTTLEDYELNRDIHDAVRRGETPDTPAGAALVARYRDALARFTGGDAGLRDALTLVMQHRARQSGLPPAAAFIQSALTRT